MNRLPTRQTVLQSAIAAIILVSAGPALAHTLDTCAPQVTIFAPERFSADMSQRSSVGQAALFLSRVDERELKRAVEGVPAEKAVPATYLFNGPDTRWRLKSPLSYRENTSRGVVGLPSQVHYLVPSDRTKPYGTIVVTGTDDGPGVLTNPSMVTHLADGKGVIIEPHDLDANCRLDLSQTVPAFLEAIAYYMDHHHHDTEGGGLREHALGSRSDDARYPGDTRAREASHAIPEFDAGKRRWTFGRQ